MGCTAGWPCSVHSDVGWPGMARALADTSLQARLLSVTTENLTDKDDIPKPAASWPSWKSNGYEPHDSREGSKDCVFDGR